MIKYIFFLSAVSFSSIVFSQAEGNLKNIDKRLMPQKVEYDGKPLFQYMVDDRIIVLDYFGGEGVRMKFSNREVFLKLEKKNSSKVKRVYSSNEYVVIFYDIIYGECAGEGSQYLTGKLLIQSNAGKNIINITGQDPFYSSKKCRETGNG